MSFELQNKIKNENSKTQITMTIQSGVVSFLKFGTPA